MLGGVFWLGGATALAVRLALLTRYEHSEEDFTMPIYEYVCQDCSHEMEALQKISDEPLKDCPTCKQPSLKKRISAAGFRLKGGGWYETDFKTKGKKNLAGDSGSSGGSDSSSAGSTSTAA